ncbi:hypothetical protein D1AOALGA4SA_3109 [Olavius algarvensis Delta 1 endosymbiont]|nr:hypothetical protein D1AOALGA4SA_3109 [Olavius algarvensis Delta 1 endosymbiont]
MEMDMSEPGEMRCCCEEEHDLAIPEKKLQSKTRLHATPGHIIISHRGIDHTS